MDFDALVAESQALYLQKLPAIMSSRDVTFSRILIRAAVSGPSITITREGSNGAPGGGTPLVIGGIGVLQIDPLVEPTATPVTTRPNTSQPISTVHEHQASNGQIDLAPTVGEPWAHQGSLDQNWLFDGIFDTSTFFDAFARGNGDLHTSGY